MSSLKSAISGLKAGTLPTEPEFGPADDLGDVSETAALPAAVEASPPAAPRLSLKAAMGSLRNTSSIPDEPDVPHLDEAAGADVPVAEDVAAAAPTAATAEEEDIPDAPKIEAPKPAPAPVAKADGLEAAIGGKVVSQFDTTAPSGASTTPKPSEAPKAPESAAAAGGGSAPTSGSASSPQSGAAASGKSAPAPRPAVPPQIAADIEMRRQRMQAFMKASGLSDEEIERQMQAYESQVLGPVLSKLGRNSASWSEYERLMSLATQDARGFNGGPGLLGSISSLFGGRRDPASTPQANRLTKDRDRIMSAYDGDHDAFESGIRDRVRRFRGDEIAKQRYDLAQDGMSVRGAVVAYNQALTDVGRGPDGKVGILVGTMGEYAAETGATVGDVVGRAQRGDVPDGLKAKFAEIAPALLADPKVVEAARVLAEREAAFAERARDVVARSKAFQDEFGVPMESNTKVVESIVDGLGDGPRPILEAEDKEAFAERMKKLSESISRMIQSILAKFGIGDGPTEDASAPSL